MRLDHLAIPCVDVAATLRFHVEVMGFALGWAEQLEGRLGFTVRVAPSLSLVFSCGPGIAPLPASTPRGDAPHVGLIVADAAERARWKQSLTASGVTVTVENEGRDERLYFADPNGVVFEIEAAYALPTQPPDEARAILAAWPATPAPPVAETFFSLAVADMQRARAFYVGALGASVSFSSPGWSSLHVAGVRVGLALVADHAGGHTGLHFAIADLDAARARVERAGGRVLQPAITLAPGVTTTKMADGEGNVFTLNQR